ncbi:MAG TPA: BON domain-containing protein [Burkholderiales bacterium]|nr:BON domain-containing protein [Burkholderiales bacterium]
MRKLLLIPAVAALSVLAGCAAAVVGTAAGTTAVVAADRRTTGKFVEDQNIEIKGDSRINERFGDQVHVSVTSFNGMVLLTGEAPTEALKEEIGRVARGVESVRDVVNDIQLAAPASYGARSNDAYITSKVKARLLDSNAVQVNYVKVVTEAGVVYLMGMVTRKEAAAATDVASTTAGVRKVVKVFEYLD